MVVKRENIVVEIEAFCNGFRGQAPGVLLTILRFAHIVGPIADAPLTRFLREEQAPSLLGFDPMMQVIHEDDVVRALLHIGFIPFPTRWYIDIGEPIPMDHYGRDADQSLVLVSQLTDQVRNIVQDMIYARLAKRRSVLFG